MHCTSPYGHNEVKDSGNTSLRTLDFMAKLSVNEARKISNVLRFAINGEIIISPACLEYISADDLIQLEEIGILYGVDVGGLKLTYNTSSSAGYTNSLTAHNKGLYITHEDSSRNLVLKGYKLTIIGKEILQFCNLVSDVNYLRDVGREIIKTGFTVFLADFIEKRDNIIIFQNHEKLTIKD